ncbi:hypothetical protein BC936DRAFT_140284 [Jimgerdemannia flammicorona]|uniref:Uncharacterized protein n=1 Tax=Jimgerdemannia flammicorona TaxID=994334 RepID=A0A433AVN5_9FUNG|nr:hypothetical protein BC936DRAFT_140284 [Jimgerdemannia flammicorona]
MRSTIFLPFVGALVTLANAEYCDKGYKLDSKFELDLSPLKKDFVITRWKDNNTVPTITEIEYCLNPCAPIGRPTETPEDEWCKAGTVCPCSHVSMERCQHYSSWGDCYQAKLAILFSYPPQVCVPEEHQLQKRR